jgi:hypothetical protein
VYVDRRGEDFWVGLSAEFESRVATLHPPEPPTPMEPGSLLWRVMTGPSGLFADTAVWNRADVHAAKMPSSNGIGTARALARHYAALIGPVDGCRTLPLETVTAASEVQADGPDRVLGMPTRFGLGFALGFGPGPKPFRHPGSGGSLGLATNRMINAGPDDGRAA